MQEWKRRPSFHGYYEDYVRCIRASIRFSEDERMKRLIREVLAESHDARKSGAA